MIENLRFVLRHEPENPIEEQKKALGQSYFAKTKKILQAYDDHVWFDVPLVENE